MVGVVVVVGVVDMCVFDYQYVVFLVVGQVGDGGLGQFGQVWFVGWVVFVFDFIVYVVWFEQVKDCWCVGGGLQLLGVLDIGVLWMCLLLFGDQVVVVQLLVDFVVVFGVVFFNGGEFVVFVVEGYQWVVFVL